MKAFPELQDALRERLRPALLVGAVGTGLTLLGLIFDSQQFFRSWLLAFLIWVGMAAGCLAMLLLVLLTRGGWGLIMRRLLEAGAKTLPLMGLLFLPLLLGLSELYPWARPEEVQGDHLLEHRAQWLNPFLFLVRAVIYFGAWTGLVVLTGRWLAAFDADPSRERKRRLVLLGGPGLVLYALTVTFAALDWGMSLEPHWFSTMYGMQYMAGQALTALAFCVAALGWLRRFEPFKTAYDKGLSRDLGNMLFAMVMLWAYLAFMQFLIIWTGNLPEEVPWYEHRTGHGWQLVAVLLIAFHFAVPFLVLLSATVKDRAGLLARVAGGVLLMRLLDYAWLVVPAFHPEGVSVSWMDFTAVAGLGGLWLYFTLRFFLGNTPLPLGERRFAEVLGQPAEAHS